MINNGLPSATLRWRSIALVAIIIGLISAIASPAIAGKAVAVPDTGAVATFRAVSFVAKNPLDRIAPVGAGEYRNPIIPGFHPDPSIVRVGRDFYLVNSSFAIYPGLPIFHSRDLVHWNLIGHAINRPQPFDFTGLGIARGVFAPSLRYHRGLFYLITTCVECGSNFIITARNPAGPWSAPAYLPAVDGIDPDLFFDSDGRVWITNNGPPIGVPRYDGHRALWIQQYDPAARRMVGPRRVIVDGGVHPADRPIWTEGPHIFRKSGQYYLIAAEGGTAGNHSETVYRAASVTGPYVPGPINPILTQRDLSPDRANPVYATGHADFVQTRAGDWWAVFLGTRPYRANLAGTGRETFLLPVTWRGGWPLILPAGTAVPQAVRRPKTESAQAGLPNSAVLSSDWIMLRTPHETWHHPAANGAIRIDARAESLTGKGNPSFLAQRQTQRTETITADLAYAPSRNGDRAGLAVFADEDHFYTFCLWQTADGPALIVNRRNGMSDPDDGVAVARIPLDHAPGHVRLRLRIDDPAYTFDYALADGTWHSALTQADSTMLASERSNQFTGVVAGLYAARR